MRVNQQLVIDAVVRSMATLIAEFATLGGTRASLANVPSRLFFHLAGELEARGAGRRVAADMFSMDVRAYLRRLARSTESVTSLGSSLWEAVYRYLSAREVVTRQEIIRDFARDDEAAVRGVLHDLTESGLVFRSGQGPSAVFRIATEAERDRIPRHEPSEGAEAIWALIFQHGPVSERELFEMLAGAVPDAAQVVESLVETGRVQRQAGLDGPAYHAARFVVPLGELGGTDAALIDHVDAVVKTVQSKVRRAADASEADVVGGSTYTLEVWPGHPLRDEVLGSLRSFRERLSALRLRVRAHNDRHPPPSASEKVVIYAGQHVVAYGASEVPTDA